MDSPSIYLAIHPYICYLSIYLSIQRVCRCAALAAAGHLWRAGPGAVAAGHRTLSLKVQSGGGCWPGGRPAGPGRRNCKWTQEAIEVEGDEAAGLVGVPPDQAAGCRARCRPRVWRAMRLLVGELRSRPAKSAREGRPRGMPWEKGWSERFSHGPLCVASHQGRIAGRGALMQSCTAHA